MSVLLPGKVFKYNPGMDNKLIVTVFDEPEFSANVEKGQFIRFFKLFSCQQSEAIKTGYN